MKFIPIDEYNYKAVMDEDTQKLVYKDLAKEIMKFMRCNSDITDIDIIRMPYKEKGKVLKEGFFFNKYEWIDKFFVIMCIFDEGTCKFLISSENEYKKFVTSFSYNFKCEKGDNNTYKFSSLYEEKFLKEAFNDYRGKRSLLKHLVSMFMPWKRDYLFDEIVLNEDSKYIIHRLDLPYDIYNDRRYPSRRNIIIEDINFDDLYSAILDELPFDSDFERSKELEEAINKNKIKKIVDVYGEDFKRKERVLGEQETDINNLSNITEIFDSVKIIEKQIGDWENKVNAKTVPQDFGNEYIKILHKKLELLSKKFYNDTRYSLEMKYGTIEELKKNFLLKIESMDKGDVNLWKKLLHEYNSIHKDLRLDVNVKLKYFTCNIEESLYYEYRKFYEYAMTLIRDIINRIDRNQQHVVSSEDLKYARMYFYKDKTSDDIEVALRKDVYSINRKAGKIGEAEVDYALKWLDKGYICVPKKYNKDIVIYNPDYIDEKQEYDHIVIGKQGVFLIETKNYVGKLIIDSYGNWIRVKGDGTQEGERNPVQQIRRHEKLLKSLLPENVDVISLICMSHPKMIVEGAENSRIPVIKSDLLAEFIETYSSKKKELSKDDMKLCLECIESHMIQ